ncbi:hypothetical protein ABG067_005433, partial [Albugo candida]
MSTSRKVPFDVQAAVWIVRSLRLGAQNCYGLDFSAFDQETYTLCVTISVESTPYMRREQGRGWT